MRVKICVAFLTYNLWFWISFLMFIWNNGWEVDEEMTRYIVIFACKYGSSEWLYD
jgi:hypothetical protein